MTPTTGVWRNDRHLYWSAFDGIKRGPFYSVTTILDVIDKPQLTYWKVNRAARFAVDHISTVNDMLSVAPGSEGDVARWIASEADRQRDKAADRGTNVHEVCARIALGQPVAAEDASNPYVLAYTQWWGLTRPSVVAVECMGINEDVGYGGTFDLIVRIEGRTWLVDLKTSKGVYPGTAGQLAAYAKFDYLGKPDDPTKMDMPKVSRFAVLHLTPEGARFIEYRIGPDTWAMFKGAKAIHMWLNGEAKTVMTGDRP